MGESEQLGDNVVLPWGWFTLFDRMLSRRDLVFVCVLGQCVIIYCTSMFMILLWGHLKPTTYNCNIDARAQYAHRCVVGAPRWFCEVVLWTPWVNQGRLRARTRGGRQGRWSMKISAIPGLQTGWTNHGGKKKNTKDTLIWHKIER